MSTKCRFLTLFAVAAITFNAKADDYAWGSTTGASMVQIDATTGKLQSLTYNGTAYTNFVLLNSATNNQLGSSLWLAQNSNGTLYGLSNSGTLYTIVTTLAQDVKKDTGFFATQVGSVGYSVTGSTFVSSNLLDFSSGSNLYQYNLTTKVTSNLGSFANNANVSGLAYGLSLYGVKYSPSPGAIESVSGVTLTAFPNSSFNGANGQSSLFAGVSVIYLADGDSSFYSYNPSTTILTPIANNFPGGLHSLTPTSVSGGGATPTPSPTATPTATPKITYTLPTGALTVTAPETTPLGNAECAPSYSYTATETSTFAAGAKIDPNGTLGINRSYQSLSTLNGAYPALPGISIPAIPTTSTPWAWTSGSTNTHGPLSYVAGTTVPFYYGREILQLVYTGGTGTGGSSIPTVLDTKYIYVYPYGSGQSIFPPNAAFTNALTNSAFPYATPNPSPSPTLTGDPPRVTVSLGNLYPSGTTSVIIYSGTPVSNPNATGYIVIPTTTATTPTGTTTNANGTILAIDPSVTFELAPYINSSVTTAQNYTIAVLQTLPSAYATSSSNPSILSPIPFTFTSAFSVNGTVGTVK